MKKPVKPVSGKPIPRGWDAAFYDFVMSLVPRGDGKTITVNHGRHGVRIAAVRRPGSSDGGASGGDGYSGSFAVTDISDASNQKVSIGAGGWTANLDSGQLAAAEITFSQTAATEYVYFERDITVSGSETAEIKHSTTSPTGESGIMRRIIASVEFSNNKISAITQQQYGDIWGLIYHVCT